MRARSMWLAAALGAALAAVAVGASCTLITGSETISGNLVDAGTGTTTTTSSTTTSTSTSASTTSTDPTTTGTSTSTSTGGSDGGDGGPACADRVVWRRIIEGAASEVTMARGAGNAVFVVASVTGSVKVGDEVLAPKGNGIDADILVVRYDAFGESDGAAWSIRLGTAGDEHVVGATVDAAGKLFLAVNYDPGEGVDTACTTNVNGNGGRQAALVEINPVNAKCERARDVFFGPGTIYDVAITPGNSDIWSVGRSPSTLSVQRWQGRTAGPTLGGGTGSTGALSIVPVGGIGVVAGSFHGTLEDYEHTAPLSGMGSEDAFLMGFKFQDTPSFKVHGDGGLALGDAQFQSFNDVATDGPALFVIGEAAGVPNFSAGMAPAGGLDVIVSKRGPDLGALWSARFGGAGDERCVATAAGGGIVAMAGDHGGGFDIGSPLDANDVNDVFIAALDNDSGAPKWSCSFGGTGEDHAKAVVATATGDVFAAGTFSGNATFGGNVDGGAGAIFVLKLSNKN